MTCLLARKDTHTHTHTLSLSHTHTLSLSLSHTHDARHASEIKRSQSPAKPYPNPI